MATSIGWKVAFCRAIDVTPTRPRMNGIFYIRAPSTGRHRSCREQRATMTTRPMTRSVRMLEVMPSESARRVAATTTHGW
jgi:hypothetical protein